MDSKSLSVAQYILDAANATEEAFAVTPMQLIKLVYIAHGYMLGKHGRPLLNESVEAWRYGPVVPSVYHAVKEFHSSPVTRVPHAPKEFPFSEKEKAVMDEVTREYAKHDGIILSSATHQPGTPWYQTWQKYGKNAPISNDLIERFYSDILSKPKHSSL